MSNSIQVNIKNTLPYEITAGGTPVSAKSSAPINVNGCTFEVTVNDKTGVPKELYYEINQEPKHPEAADTFTVTLPSDLCSPQKGPVADPTVNVTIGDENVGDPD